MNRANIATSIQQTNQFGRGRGRGRSQNIQLQSEEATVIERGRGRGRSHILPELNDDLNLNLHVTEHIIDQDVS